MARTLRFKEFDRNIDRQVTPTAKVSDLSDESLPSGPFRHRTDEHGFTITGNNVPPQSPNLIIIGDSFAESLYADEDKRYASQIERQLMSDGNTHRVLNAGYSGMTSLHMLGVVYAKLPEFATPGSKLLLTIGQSDTNALLSPGFYWDSARTVSPFVPHTHGQGAPGRGWREELWSMVTALTQTARALGFELLLSTGLFRNGDFSSDVVLRSTFRRQRHMYERTIEVRHEIPRIVKSVSVEQSVPYFDSAKHLLERPELFYDALHLNHAGQDLYSQMLSSWINGITEPSSKDVKS